MRMEEQHSWYFNGVEIALATLSVLLKVKERAKHEAAARLIPRQLLETYLLGSSVLLKRGTFLQYLPPLVVHSNEDLAWSGAGR